MKLAFWAKMNGISLTHPTSESGMVSLIVGPEIVQAPLYQLEDYRVDRRIETVGGKYWWFHMLPTPVKQLGDLTVGCCFTLPDGSNRWIVTDGLCVDDGKTMCVELCSGKMCTLDNGLRVHVSRKVMD